VRRSIINIFAKHSHRLDHAAIDILLVQYTLISSLGSQRNVQHSQGMHSIRLHVIISKAVILWQSSFHIVQLSCTVVHSLSQKNTLIRRVADK